MADLFANNPPVSFTLAEYNRFASNLYHHRLFEEFCRFCVVGEYSDPDEPHRVFQVFLDALRGRPAAPPLSIRRDYDSLLGVSPTILVLHQLNVFTVPHPSYALTSSIHIKYEVKYEGKAYKVPFHHIPNFEFASWDDRNSVTVFYPGLWTPDRAKSTRPHHLTEEQRAFWYENGLRPAIQELMGEDVASEWPATYAAEKERAKNHNGSFSWSKKVIPAEVVEHLMPTVRRYLADYVFAEDEDFGWAEDFFVLHTIHGVKHGTLHHLDRLSSLTYLMDFLDSAHLPPDIVDNPDLGDWFIDVGIEISSPAGDCVQWITSTHQHVVEQALRVPENHAIRVTKITSSKYERDIASHLPAISGFHLEPGPQAEGPFRAAYLQAYTTDKAVVYNLDGRHHSKFVTAQDVMSPKLPSSAVLSIHSIYSAAKTANPSKARLEARIPLRFATNVLLEFDPAIMRSCLCTFSRIDWWNFRVVRLQAFSQLLTLQVTASTLSRFQPEALALTAACIWLINSLHSRPEDGPAARQLMQAALPLTDVEGVSADVLLFRTSTRRRRLHTHVDDDDENADIDENRDRGDEGGNGNGSNSDNDEVEVEEHIPAFVPYAPYGCIFLRRIVIADAPRLRIGGVTLSDSAFEFWFKMDQQRLEAKHRKTGIVDKEVVASTRITTNKRRTVERYREPNMLELDLFNLAADGHSIPQPVIDDGSDVEDRDSPGPEDPLSIDEELSLLWRQFVTDLTCKSPNPHGQTNGSYLQIDEGSRRRYDESPYKTLHLAEIFTAVHYKQSPTETWRRCFDWYFPPLGKKISSSAQNYPTVKYYDDWGKIMERLQDQPQLIENIRNQFFARVREWSWMPNAQGDKMWTTSVKKPSCRSFIRWPPCEKKSPAPLILLKTGAVPIFTIRRNQVRPRHPLAQEEEEEEEEERV